MQTWQPQPSCPTYRRLRSSTARPRNATRKIDAKAFIAPGLTEPAPKIVVVQEGARPAGSASAGFNLTGGAYQAGRCLPQSRKGASNRVCVCVCRAPTRDPSLVPQLARIRIPIAKHLICACRLHALALAHLGVSLWRSVGTCNTSGPRSPAESPGHEHRVAAAAGAVANAAGAVLQRVLSCTTAPVAARGSPRTTPTMPHAPPPLTRLLRLLQPKRHGWPRHERLAALKPVGHSKASDSGAAWGAVARGRGKRARGAGGLLWARHAVGCVCFQASDGPHGEGGDALGLHLGAHRKQRTQLT